MEQPRTPLAASPEGASPPAPHKAARRSNAEYRWTLPKALAFLEELAECGKVAEAARRVGMSSRSAFRLRGRLAGTPLERGWDLALGQGIAARRQRQAHARWDSGFAQLPRRPQGDGYAAQGDGSGAQGHGLASQGHGFAPQGARIASGRVTRVNTPPPAGAGGAAQPPRDSPAGRNYSPAPQPERRSE
jgi:hypothetical protein